MRNNLAELPVLLACMRAGFCAGGAAYLLRLPKRAYLARRRGLRTPFAPDFLFVLLDFLTCASAALTLASALVWANGGEPRLYALAGFFCAMALTVKLLENVIF